MFRVIFIFAFCSLRVFADDAQPSRPLTPIPRTERLPASQPTTRPAPPSFIVGVWYPPASSMALWKARGVNTAIGYEHQSNQVSIDEWSAAAVGNGLYMIRQPRPQVADDLRQPNLLALMHLDEPDLKKVDPPVLADLYAQWKKDAPGIPVFLSVSGGGVLFRKTPRVVYQQYFESADWIANDFYPVTGWNQPTWIPRLGQAVDQCRTLSRGKPQFAFIETSSQQLAWMPRETRGVTPAELRAEIWDAVIHGVKGIIYFPQQFNPFVYDATPSAVSVEMAKQNGILAEMSSILSRPANPREVGVSVQPPLEAGWRRWADGTLYIIVLNTSPQTMNAKTIKLTGAFDSTGGMLKEGDRSLVIENNELKDNFEPLQCRIYTIGKPISQGKR